MKDLEVVRALLVANAGVVAACGSASQIMAGPLPPGVGPPAISLAHISSVRPQLVKAGSGVVVARVQITAVGRVYDEAKTMLLTAKAALPRSRGTVAAVAVESVVIDTEGADMYDVEAGLFFSTLDVIVTYNE